MNTFQLGFLKNHNLYLQVVLILVIIKTKVQNKNIAQKNWISENISTDRIVGNTDLKT